MELIIFVGLVAAVLIAIVIASFISREKPGDPADLTAGGTNKTSGSDGQSGLPSEQRRAQR